MRLVYLVRLLEKTNFSFGKLKIAPGYGWVLCPVPPPNTGTLSDLNLYRSCVCCPGLSEFMYVSPGCLQDLSSLASSMCPSQHWLLQLFYFFFVIHNFLSLEERGLIKKKKIPLRDRMPDTAWRPGARDWIAQRPGVEPNMTAKRKARDFYQWSAVLIDQRGF